MTADEAPTQTPGDTHRSIGQSVAVLTALALAIVLGTAAAPSGVALPLFAIVLVGAMVVAAANLQYGLVVGLTAVALLPAPFSVRVAGATLTAGRVLLLATLLGWFTQRRRAGMERPRSTPLDLFMGVLIGAQLASFIVNLPAEHGSVMSGAISRVGVFAVDFFLLYRVVTVAFRQRSQAIRFVRYLTGLITVIAALGLVEWVTGRNVFEFLSPVLPGRVNRSIAALADAAVLQRGAISRIHSTLGHPLALAVLLLIALPLAAAFALGAESTAARVRWTVASVTISTAILFTASRGAYLILVPMFLTMVVLAPDRRARASLAMVTGGFVVLALLIPDVRGTMTYHLRSLTAPSARGASIEHRTSAYGATVELLADRPVFGFGPGTFTASELRQNRLLSDRVEVPVLDNGYLELVAETGAIGAVSVIGFLFAAALMTYRVYRSAVTRRDRLLGAALVTSVEAWILFAFFADVYGYGAPPRVFFALLGVVAVLRTHPPARRRRPLMARQRPLVAAPI